MESRFTGLRIYINPTIHLCRVADCKPILQIGFQIDIMDWNYSIYLRLTNLKIFVEAMHSSVSDCFHTFAGALPKLWSFFSPFRVGVLMWTSVIFQRVVSYNRVISVTSIERILPSANLTNKSTCPTVRTATNPCTSVSRRQRLLRGFRQQSQAHSTSMFTMRTKQTSSELQEVSQ